MMTRALAIATLIALAPAIAAGQQVRVVTGIVRDSVTARPLQGTLVTLIGEGYQEGVPSEDDGTFRFTRVKPGRYTIAARRLGYAPFSASVEIGERPDTLVVSLARVALMDTVRVRPGTGISGVVGTSRGLRPLRDVQIQVIGSTAKALTDSNGRFFVPLAKPGVFIVRTRADGYSARTTSVTVAKDSVEDVMLLLDSALVGASNRTEVAWREFGDRLRRRGASAALVARADLLRDGEQGLLEAIQRASSVTGKNLRFSNTVCIFIDGYPSPTTPLAAIDVMAIEAVEVYTEQSEETRTLARQSRGFECHPTGLPRVPATQRNVIRWVVVWMKK